MLTTAIIGLSSSIVTELLKYIPFLRTNGITKALTAIVVAVVVSLGYSYSSGAPMTLESVLGAIAASILSYKAIIEPFAWDANLKSQGTK